MEPIRVALLPMYVALYDTSSPHMRPEIEAFAQRIAGSLQTRGLEVFSAPVCRLQEEFAQAIRTFEQSGAEAIVTLHLAYSPSLESAKPLSQTELPLIVLDTTPDYLFDTTVSSDRLMYNHGIHGVQDMCNLLVRNGKPFAIFAGHAEHSDVLDRVAAAARAAAIWTRLSHARVGLIGEPFKGMGDFQVPESLLQERLGITVLHHPMDGSAPRPEDIDPQELEAEYNLDSQRVDMGPEISRETYDATERVALSVRHWIERENLTAFSMNFEEAGRHSSFPTMPFSEACKAMSRGVGYAGEGDALTAAFVSALLRAHPDTTFAEMFCPNWSGNTIFFSHMGEFNLNACDGRPHMIVKDFCFGDGFNPTSILGHFKPGAVCFANLAPVADGFRLILADGEMVKLAERIGSFEDSVSGWFRPNLPIAQFLEAYSRAGGTHHGALVYGATADELRNLAVFANMECAVIQG